MEDMNFPLLPIPFLEIHKHVIGKEEKKKSRRQNQCKKD